jgi:hypothetical protein
LRIRAIIRDSNLGNQEGVVSKRGEYDLVCVQAVPRGDFPIITNSKDAVKGFGIARVTRAKHNIAVSQVPETPCVYPVTGVMVIEELGTPFVLPHLHVAVIRRHADQAVVPHLVQVLGG